MEPTKYDPDAFDRVEAKAALIDDEVDKLIESVCSPGGSTIEGVKTLDGGAMEDVVRDAVMASYKRNLELGKS